MNNDLMLSYLQNVGEWVIDEDKIVTYKWLSKTLGTHINTAKQLLFAYLSEQKKKSPCKVTATHLLAGEMKDGTKGVLIVNEEDLGDTRDAFNKITSEHVYSIQKSQYLKSLQVLYAANKSIQNAEGFKSPIKCSKSILRLKSSHTSEIAKEKSASNGTLEKKIDIVGKEHAKEGKEMNKKGSSPQKENENTGKESLKSKAQAGKKGVNSGKGQNIANFFNNQGATKSSKSRADPPKKLEENENLNKMETSDEKDVTEKTRADAGDQNNKKSSVRPKKQRKEKKKNKEESEGRKRKRIKVFSDSDESCDESPEENVSSPVKSEEGLPEEEIELKMEGVELEDEPVPQNKRKKRKIIDKLVVHDDGFMETKKEVVYETDSGNEEDQHAKEQEDMPKRSSPRKKGKIANENLKTKQTSSACAQQKKQSSLYSFFKKN